MTPAKSRNSGSCSGSASRWPPPPHSSCCARWRRSISADDEAITTQQGRRIPYTDLKTLDLRKWETKGLAFLDYDGTAGKGRLRIDGLTYGGFKKENDEPAERLMRRIRSRFSGELIEYAPLAAGTPATEGDSGTS